MDHFGKVAGGTDNKGEDDGGLVVTKGEKAQFFLSAHQLEVVANHMTEAATQQFAFFFLTFVQGYGQAGDIAYINKHWVLDLGYLPSTLDTTLHFADLKDFVATRLGLQCALKEVATGQVVQVEQEEHEIRESIRQNSAVVRPTFSAQLDALQLKYSQVMLRLQQLGISLG